MAAIAPIRSIPLAGPSPATAAAGQPGAFRRVLEGAIGGVEQSRAEAAQAVESLLTGQGGELHATLLAAQRAELALELFLQTRNKVVEAYQEIMRMQL
ncbi:MAG: flagellar hook-basal body complex protein FliE [Bryobacterales bacterium]|nr:flagellar hook-basal body complex protein FliE [Bryobacterales bacterium]